MISELFLQLICVSLVCGAAICFIPEGGCKHICQVICTAALINSILTPFLDFDFSTYSIESAKLKEREFAFIQDATTATDNLNRAVIQGQYHEYILDKARELGLDELQAEINMQWSEEGLWLPYSAEIKGNWETAQMNKLKRLISDELGIPEERQQWKRG